MATLEAHKLEGKKVVDINSGEQVGSVSDLLVDSSERRVAALVVSRGSALGGDQGEQIVPAEAVQAIGRDAITVDRAVGGAAQASYETETTARTSSVKGRRIVTTGGRDVGRVDDVLIDSDTGDLTGYRVSTGPLGGALGRRDADEAQYVRADPDVRLGEDVVIVPDEAVISQAEGRRTDSEMPVQWHRGRARP